MRWACLLVLIVGCLEADRIELNLITPRSFRPDALQTLSVRIEDSSGVVVAEGSSEERGVLFDLGVLNVGESYRVRVDANADCANGRATGRSLPFTHERGGYAIPVQIGCADEFGVVRAPSRARLAAGLVTDGAGGGVLMGGASALQLSASGLAIDDPDRAVDRYDPRSGAFRPVGTLATPRAWPAAVALPSGDVAGAIGGVLPSLPLCESSVEVTTGDLTRVAASLTAPRCTAAAAVLPAANVVLVAGGTSNRTVRDIDAEALSIDLEEVVVPRLRGQAYRTNPALVPTADGGRAVLIGGVTDGSGPRAELLSLGPGCPDEMPCSSPVPVEAGPTGSWTEVTASRVECSDGTGAIYAIGGETEDTGLRSIWCARDASGSMGFERVGELPAPRTRHVQVTVAGPDGDRLLVVGGSRNSGIALGVHDDALLIPANGCSCQVGPIDGITLPLTGVPLFHSATVLGDGTVLVVGGVRITVEGPVARINATGEAILFTPDRGAL